MKDAFPEYYSPTQGQFDALWRDCMFRKTDTILNSELLESLKTLRATNLPDARVSKLREQRILKTYLEMLIERETKALNILKQYLRD